MAGFLRRGIIMLYPAFIKLEKKTVIVIGGSVIAERKIRQLLKVKAMVICISKDINKGIQRIKGIKKIKKDFLKSHVKEYAPFVIINASGDVNIDQMLIPLIKNKNILYNSVDVPEYCNFYVPAIIQQKQLLIAISTLGKSPFMTGFIKKSLMKLIKPEWSSWINLFQKIRKELKRTSLTYREKLSIHQKIVKNKKIIALVNKGDKKKSLHEARAMMKKLI
jgi:precorrin-2 dehydrogenase/sirohydrochlorin ferrochelatase